jgi:hypothetical protein
MKLTAHIYYPVFSWLQDNEVVTNQRIVEWEAFAEQMLLV